MLHRQDLLPERGRGRFLPGACQAIEDGCVLAAALGAEPDDPVGALALYERSRRPRASRVVLAARERGVSNHLASRSAARRRDLSIAVRRRLGRDPDGRGTAWIPTYDASAPEALAGGENR
jgi:salicylate hydroxylase